MNLLQQFQGVLGSLMLGGLLLFFFHFFQTFFNHKYLRFFWYAFQALYFLSFAVGYYVFLCEYTYGIYNFFFTLSLISGSFLYLAFYKEGVKRLLNPISKKIDRGIEQKEKKIKQVFQKKRMKRKEKKIMKKNKKIENTK